MFNQVWFTPFNQVRFTLLNQVWGWTREPRAPRGRQAAQPPAARLAPQTRRRTSRPPAAALPVGAGGLRRSGPLAAVGRCIRLHVAGGAGAGPGSRGCSRGSERHGRIHESVSGIPVWVRLSGVRPRSGPKLWRAAAHPDPPAEWAERRRRTTAQNRAEWRRMRRMGGQSVAIAKKQRRRMAQHAKAECAEWPAECGGPV